MKMIVLLHLKEDDVSVSRLFTEAGVQAWSRLPLEGHGAGLAGWYGEVSPYLSRMTFTLVKDTKAVQIMSAVSKASGLSDVSHPIHALQFDVERSVDSGPGSGGLGVPQSEEH